MSTSEVGNGQSTQWSVNSRARTWTCAPASHEAQAFHGLLDGYGPTPLHEAPALARELEVARLFVKDESARFDLGAFKILGASWAVFRALAEKTDYQGESTIAALGDWLRPHAPFRLVTATDGNHGRAVARMARLLGLVATVYVPDVVPHGAVDLIRSEGCEVKWVNGSYDDAVDAARDCAGSDCRAVLIQDTSWEGYEAVPTWIVDGYATLFLEVDRQLAARGVEQPDLVAVPAGVGSLAQAAIAHYRGGDGSPRTALLNVEPDTAACVLASLLRGERHSVETRSTPMNGLNCGTPSPLAWPFLKHGLDAAVAISDAESAAAVEDLASLGISSGHSGAASLAGIRRVVAGSLAAELRPALGVTVDSTVVVVSTEGNHRSPSGARHESRS